MIRLPPESTLPDSPFPYTPLFRLCVLLLMMSRVMPESPRWLAARGRDVEADAVVRKFERHQRIEAVNSPAPFTASDASAKGSASSPISYLRLLVVACVMKTAVNAGIYLFMQWLTTILLAIDRKS